MSLSTRIPRLRHAAAACVLLFGLGACSVRDDGSDVKRDASGAIAGAGTSSSHSTATVANGNGAGHAATVSDAGTASRTVSRTVVANVADTLAANADVYAGWRSFNINCQSCHGFNAVANDAAPDLRNSVRNGGTLTRAQFHEVVRKGRMAKGMPAWGELLDAKQIDQIYAYLRARSSGTLGAGQPSVGGE
jgi:mono/diheme cytochrome c family protein